MGLLQRAGFAMPPAVSGPQLDPAVTPFSLQAAVARAPRLQHVLELHSPGLRVLARPSSELFPLLPT